MIEDRTRQLHSENKKLQRRLKNYKNTPNIDGNRGFRMTGCNLEDAKIGAIRAWVVMPLALNFLNGSGLRGYKIT